MARGRASAELALVGGRVLTLDPALPEVRALAIRDGRIIGMGSDAEIRELCDARTHVEWLRDSVVVPGLTDGHAHPIWGTELTQGADCTECRTRDELAACLRTEREREGPGAVIRGWGVDYALFADTGMEGSVLEPLADGPAIVTFTDMHTRIATPSVMRMAEITERPDLPENSEVVFRDGMPTGELREFAAWELVQRGLGDQSLTKKRVLVAQTLQAMNAVGIAAAHVMDGGPETYELLEDMEAHGELSVRLVVPVWVKPEMEDDEISELLDRLDERGRRWRGGVVKFFIDGVIETGTSWLEEPDSEGGGTRALWPEPSRYAATVARFAERGFQCATHAIGDRAVRMALDAYAAADTPAGVRHRIEHLEVAADAEVARLAPEGVVASMQPLHMQWRQADGGDEWTRRVGPERAARAWRVRDVWDSGAAVVLGSDWPVASKDPRLGMAWARLRRRPGDPDAPVFDADQRLSGAETLLGYTKGAAFATSEERVAGTVALGSRADLTGFAEDPSAVAGDDLPDLPVRLVVVDGEVVHRG